MIQEFEFKLDGETFRVCYTARARFMFERLAGYPVEKLKVWDGAPSDVEAAQVIAAGLEGDRVRNKRRKAAWTVDEVLDDVIGSAGVAERLGALRTCIEAINAAFRGSASPEAATSDAGKAATTS